MDYETLPTVLREKITEIINQRGKLLEYTENEMIYSAYLEKDGQFIVLLVSKIPSKFKTVLMDVITNNELAVFVRKSKTAADIAETVLREKGQ